MKVTILKEFAYGADGVNATALVEGSEVDILDDLAPGLIKEGFVREYAERQSMLMTAIDLQHLETRPAAQLDEGDEVGNSRRRSKSKA